MNEKVAMEQRDVEPGNTHGGNRRSKEVQVLNSVVEKEQTRVTDKERWKKRIARDHPDVHEAMKEGKYRSVREAAIDAGIVKPRQQWSAPGPVEKLAAMIYSCFCIG